MTTEGSQAISGYIFKIGNATVSWSSKQQSLVSLSVTEAKLMALTYAT